MGWKLTSPEEVGDKEEGEEVLKRVGDDGRVVSFDHGEARVAPLGSMRIEGLLQKEKQGVSLLSLGPL